MANPKDTAKPHGPVTLKNGWTVEVDVNTCIGAAPCVGVAPKSFELDANQKAFVLETCDEDDVDTILNAARSCPTSAITVKNEKGEVVFPS